MDRKALIIYSLITFILYTNLFAQISISDDIYSNTIPVDTIVPNQNKSSSYSEIIIDSTSRIGDNLAEIISRESGITYRKDGATGSKSTVSIRGIQNSKIKIFLDGIAINSVMGEAVDLSKIDPDIIEKIEIYKGKIPAKFGGNGFGGIINLIKKRQVGENQNLNISALIGSFGELKLNVESWFIPSYRMDLYNNINFQKAKNNYPYLNQGSTPLDSSDDEIRLMVNDKFSKFQFKWMPTFYLSRNRSLRFDLNYQTIEDEIEGINDIENETASENSNQFSMSLVLSNYRELQKQSIKKLQYEISLNYSYLTNEIYWTNLDNFGIPHGALNDGEWGELTFNENVLDFKGLLSFNLNKKSMLETALFFQANSMLPESRLKDDIVGDWDCFRVSTVIASDFLFNNKFLNFGFGGAIVLNIDSTGGGNGGYDDFFRYTVKSQSEFNWDWSLHGELRFSFFKDRLGLGLSGGRNNNLISLREKYGTKSGTVPNPDLKDQKLYTFDFSADLLLNKFLLGGTFFCLKEFNPVIYYRSGTINKPVNIDESLIYGGEFSFDYNIHENIKINTELTIQDPKSQQNDINGNLIPYESQLSLYSGIVLGPFYGLSILWDLEYFTRYFEDPENKHSVPHDLSLLGSGNNSFGMEWQKKNIKLETYIKNLPLKLFNFDHYKNYAYEYGNDQSGNGYGYGKKPGIKYYFRINYSL